MSMAASKSEGFRSRMEAVVGAGYLTAGLGIGHTLGLFKIMIDLGKPATAGDIASLAECKPGYVEKWLRWMTAGGIVNADETVCLFNLPVDHWAGVQCKMVVYSSLLPSLLFSHDKLMDVFTLDGPLGLNDDDLSRWFHTWETQARPAAMDELLPEKIAQIKGLHEKLVSGLTVLDIGCSRGSQLHWLAARYPKSVFTGLDLSPDIIKEAEETAISKCLSNVTFLVGNAQSLPSDWSEQFDLVVLMNCFHHFPNLNKATVEIFRVLKPGGLLSIVESNVNPNPRKEVGDHKALMGHAHNLYYCYSASANIPGSDALGCCAGTEKILEILECGGFDIKSRSKSNKLGKKYVHISCTK